MPRPVRSAHQLPAAIALAVAALCASPTIAKPKDCFYPIRRALERGGYNYGLDCRTTFVDRLQRVGRMTKGRWRYTVYDLSYSFLSHPGGPMHGDRRLLFFDIRGDYVGQLSGIDFDDQELFLINSTLFFEEKGEPDMTLSLTRHGLPPRCRSGSNRPGDPAICIYR